MTGEVGSPSNHLTFVYLFDPHPLTHEFGRVRSPTYLSTTFEARTFCALVLPLPRPAEASEPIVLLS